MAGAGWAGGGGIGSDPYSAVVYVALLPIAVVAGAITGAIMAHPESEVIEATTAIKEALTDA